MDNVSAHINIPVNINKSIANTVQQEMENVEHYMSANIDGEEFH